MAGEYHTTRPAVLLNIGLSEFLGCQGTARFSEFASAGLSALTTSLMEYKKAFEHPLRGKVPRRKPIYYAFTAGENEEASTILTHFGRPNATKFKRRQNKWHTTLTWFIPRGGWHSRWLFRAIRARLMLAFGGVVMFTYMQSKFQVCFNE
mgnify:CR=1 FL=1